MDIYEEIKEFYQSVNAEKRVIGKSLFDRDIFAIKIGQGSPVGIVQYAIHGREFITAKLAKVHFEKGVQTGSLWFVPLSNPDGALLSQIGLASVKKEADKTFLLSINGGKEDFSLWKANGRGVDLNVNFPARWGKGVQNVKSAGAANYIGTSPFSELETIALKDLTERVRPDYTVSYHTKGEEIYWYFHQSTHTCLRDLRLAKVISKVTGYPVKKTEGSVGGYKDWCIERWKIPSFTIETGQDAYAHPLGDNAFQDIKRKNESVLFELSKAIEKELKQ